MSTLIDYSSIEVYYSRVMGASESTARLATDDTASVYSRYQDNLLRHMLAVSTHLSTRVMHILQTDCGHSDLRLSFSPYIGLIGGGPVRLSTLAELMSISRQACNQAVRQLEKAGYVTREADPNDGRARLLALTTAGKRLRKDGQQTLSALDQELTEMVGKQAAADAAEALNTLYLKLAPSIKGARHEPTQTPSVGAALPGLADYIMLRLMQLTQSKGHPQLKLSFAQVLLHIGPDGGRIQHMAALHDVSKQAISAIASDLEQLGYLRREADPADARQVLLHFTPMGEALIADSVASIDAVIADFSQHIGDDALQGVKAVMRTLYHDLALEAGVFTHHASSWIEALDGANPAVDLTLLAEQLRRQLDVQQRRQLAALLTHTTHQTHD